MKLLDGKKLSQKILKDLKKELKESKLKLAIVLVGNNPDSKKFIKQKQKACQFIGIDFKLFKFPAQIQGAKLLKEIKEIIKDSSISGIVIQLPLPKKLNTEKILKSIPKEKDAEIISPVVCAIERILKEYKISLRNKKIVLIGKGRLVGQPVASWLRKQNLKFSSINKIKQADLIISGMGRANFIKGEMIKKGAIIIDVGEDVDFESVSKKAGYITPTPGGVGPMTVACLLKNLVDSKK
jgi:methylenetetrahydrofolate dehydrogenase (NADP+)/methenyltetrahydrofolate cyclohydrolase